MSEVEQVEEKINCTWHIGARTQLHIGIDTVPYILDVPAGCTAVQLIEIGKAIESIGLDIIKQQDDADKKAEKLEVVEPEVVEG